MPSPVGHSLIGLILGLGAVWRKDSPLSLAQAWSARWPLLGAVALANLPDVDYVPGVLAGDLNLYHHGLTHTVGWCLLAAAGTWLILRAWRPAWGRVSVLGWFAALTCSHLLADWLTADNRPPIGIMALWPLDHTYRIAPVTIFWALHKRNYAEILEWHNVLAVSVEVLWCLPLLMAVWFVRRAGAGKGNAAR